MQLCRRSNCRSQPRDTGGAGVSTDEILEEMAVDMLKRLPDGAYARSFVVRVLFYLLFLLQLLMLLRLIK